MFTKTAAMSVPWSLRERTAPPSEAVLAAARRVQLVIVAVLLMGFADLACTVIYMTHIGLLEANPLARFMIELGGLRQLVLFKLATMVVSSGCLYLARFHRTAEPMAWTCAAILLLLTIHWVNYNERIPSLTREINIIAFSDPTM
ncbi:MAG: DUF5658 family protein, partial [Planctomycetota bacterium]